MLIYGVKWKRPRQQYSSAETKRYKVDKFGVISTVLTSTADCRLKKRALWKFECPAIHNLSIKRLGSDFAHKQVLINNPDDVAGFRWRLPALSDTRSWRRRRNEQEIDATPDLRGCSTVEELWRGRKLYGLLVRPEILTWRRCTGRFTTYRFHNVMQCRHLSSDARLIAIICAVLDNSGPLFC